jgi:hypothetical protein
VTFQYEPPVSVYNGPDLDYLVNVAYTNDGATQLFGVDDRWLDAFSRLRVSEGVSLLESSFQYDLQPNLFEAVTATNGTVTHDSDLASAVLTTSTDDGSLAALQSYRYTPYAKGRSHLIKQTAQFGAAVENVRRRMGYFDAANGVFLSQESTGVSFVKRSSVTGVVVDTSVPQASWNLDTLDGTGPSGVVLDASKGIILCIDFQWLGVGRIRIGFNIGGGIIWCHEFNHANETGTQPYWQTATLPVRWEITNTAASAGATLQAICVDVESEGGRPNPTGLSFSAANLADVNTSTTRAALLVMRPTADYPAGGATNRESIIPGNISVLATGADVLIEVFYNPTVTGSFTRVDASSGVEVNVGATISATGIRIASFFVASGAGAQTAGAGGSTLASQYPIALDAAGANPRGLMITATTRTGTGSARAALDWVEIR